MKLSQMATVIKLYYIEKKYVYSRIMFSVNCSVQSQIVTGPSLKCIN